VLRYLRGYKGEMLVSGGLMEQRGVPDEFWSQQLPPTCHGQEAEPCEHFHQELPFVNVIKQ